MKKKIALQLYTVRAAGDMSQRVKLAQETGYAWVETEATYGLQAEAFTDTLNTHRVQLASMHVEMADLRDRLPTILAALSMNNCKQLVMPWLEEDERPTDVNTWTTFATELNQFALTLATHGIQLSYHNHAFEFDVLANGRTILETIMENAPQLHWQADIAWVVRAGQDPLTWIQRFSERILSVHVKDLAANGSNLEENDWANLGEGKIPWQQILDILPSKVETFIVEHDQPSNPRRTAQVGNDFLRQYFATSMESIAEAV